MTDAERLEARLRRQATRKRAEDAAYARGDCVECYQPHNNINLRTGLPTRVCARCQAKRTVRQRLKREAERHRRNLRRGIRVVTRVVLVSTKTVLGQ